MNKIKLFGKSNLATDDFIKANRDYGIFLIASRISEEKPDDEDYFVYRLKISHIESINDLKESKKIEFKNGQSPSQKLRFIIEQNLGQDEYENMMGYLLSRMDSLCDDYRENNKII